MLLNLAMPNVFVKELMMKIVGLYVYITDAVPKSVCTWHALPLDAIHIREGRPGIRLL